MDATNARKIEGFWTDEFDYLWTLVRENKLANFLSSSVILNQIISQEYIFFKQITRSRPKIFHDMK